MKLVCKWMNSKSTISGKRGNKPWCLFANFERLSAYSKR